MAETTYFFYDLETSGIDPKQQRVMQFAGQRTNANLEPIGEPYNVLVRLSDDILPSPSALLVTGITPQAVRDGLREDEFVQLIHQEICVPGTILTGFNSIRFDDEFLRYASYRNLRDPYSWSYGDGRSRWDLLDVVRMTRALRPTGISWPMAEDGRPSNKLEHIAAANGLVHTKAHDALSDVEVLIDVARLLREKQPKLYQYLLEHRDKNAVGSIIGSQAPFVYTTGRYPMVLHHTSVAIKIASTKNPNAVLVYNLRHDPQVYQDLSVDELRALVSAPFAERSQPGFTPFPVKTLSTNKCPMVAPLSVLTPEAELNIQLTQATALQHLATLTADKAFIARLVEAQERSEPFPPANDVDGALYESFLPDSDKRLLEVLVKQTPQQLAEAKPAFSDQRLSELLWRYRARLFPESLSRAEQRRWNRERSERIQTQLPAFTTDFTSALARATPAQALVLEDLRLWVENLFPTDYEEDDEAPE